MSRQVRSLFILAVVAIISVGLTALAPAATPARAVAGEDPKLNSLTGNNFTVGVQGTYVIVIQNNGDTATTNPITLTDNIPTGLTYTGFTGAGWSCPAGPIVGPNPVVCTFPAGLAALGQTQLNLTVSVSATAVPNVTNQVSFTMPGDVDTTNNSGSVVTNVNSGVDLTVTKSHVGNFTVGVQGQYTIRVTNSGTGPTNGLITVTDVVPAGFMTVSTATGNGWDCSGTTPSAMTCTTSAVIPAGAPANDITLVVTPIAAGTPTNTARVFGGGAPFDNSWDDTTTIVAGPDLSIAKTATSPFTVNRQTTYTITVTNIGGGVAVAPFTVQDTLPAELQFVSGGGTGWNACSASGQVVTCIANQNIAASGGSSVITLNVMPIAVGTGIANTATLNPSASGDNNASNNTSNPPTAVDINNIDLSITKSHTGNFARGQSGAQYDIAVKNNGNGPTLAAIDVTDTLPAGLTFHAAGSGGSGFTCSAAGQVVTCTSAGPIAAGATVTFPILVDVGATAAASLSNTASVATLYDNNAANNTSTPDVVTIDAPDLIITKSHTPATNFARNTSRTFTFVVTNNGTGPTFGATTINDTLPTGLTVASPTPIFTLINPAAAPPWASPACAAPVGGQSFTCTFAGQIAPGASVTIEVEVDVDSAAPLGPTTNVATVSTAGDSNTGNNTSAPDNIVIDPAPVPDLTLTKTNGGTFQVGSNGTFVLTVTNQGNLNTTTTTTVTDTLPPGFNYVSSSPAGWTCVPAAGPPVVVTCQFAGVIGQGAGNAQTLTLTVAPTTAGGFTNNANVAGGGEVNTTNNTASSTGNVAPAPSPDAAITKSTSGTTYVQNVLNSFVIAVSNAGAVDINAGTTVTVTDNLSSGMTYIAAGSGTGGWTCPGADVAGPNTVVCTHAGPVTAGASLPNLILNVQPTALGNIPNSATVSLTGQTDGNPANNTSSVTVNVLPPNTPDLRITKTHADPFTQGVLSSYSLAVQNVGSGDTTGIITVTDTLPPGMTFSSGSGGGFTCNLTTPPSTVTCTSPGPITVGSTATITLNVNPGTVGSGTNVATVSTPGDPNSGNNTSNDITNISGIPDLTVTKTHAGNFYVGQTDAQYTITVNNVGSGASTGTITVQDTLPAGLTFNAVTSGTFTCAPPNSVNPTCTSTSSIPAGGSISFTMRVNVTAAGSGTNLVAVSGGGETNAANNNGSDPTTIDAAASIDLQLVSKTGPASFTVGTNGTYTITVRNIGNASSTGTITVADTLPAGMTLVSASGGIFTCTGTGTANVSCTSPGPLAANQTATITLTVVADATTASSVTNTATVSGGGDTNNANNQASTPAIPVVGAPNLTVAKTHVGNFFAGQTNAVYTITVQNISGGGGGGGPTTGPIQLTDNLPAGMTLVTYTPISGTWTCSGTSSVTCTNPGPIAFGGTSQLRLIVNVPSTSGSLIATNTVTVSTPGDSNPADNTSLPDTQTILSQPNLSGAVVSISANPSTNVNADNSTASTVTVNVSLNGLPLGGVPVALTTNPSGATVSGQVNTDNSGNATFTVKSGTATTYTVTPTFPNSVNPPSASTTIQFVTPTATATPNPAQATSTAAAAVAAGSSNPQGSTVTVDCTTVPADNVFKANITVTLRNSSGGAVPSKNVSLTSSPALTGLVITPTQGVSDTNGQVKFTAQSPTQGGPITFTATNTSDSITIGTVQVTFGRPGTQAVCPAPSTTGAGGLPATSLNLLNLPLDGPGIGQVIPYRLRVRTGPGLQFQQIGTLQGKQLVTLLGRDSRGRWFLIRLQNGGVGWVSAFYIRVRRLAFRHLPIVDQTQLNLPTAPAPGVAPTAVPR